MLPESAYELRAALRRGEASAVAAVERSLDRIEAGADLGSFVAVTAELALDQARSADRRFAESADRSSLPALHGLPIAHKDLVDVAGVPTTRGSAALPHPVAAKDDPGVATLRAAGAVSLGKTQVPEFGLTGYSENLIAPPARNPLAPGLTPGGSSGGSAAAVAAGMLPLAPASDGGGSIRIPALACGLIGLKPGIGAIATDDVGTPRDEFGAPRLAVSGPLARDARDAAMLFDAMRGASGRAGARGDDAADGLIEPAVEAVRRAESLTGLRIGISTASPFEAAYPIRFSADALRALEIAAARLADRGHAVEEAAIDYDPRYPEAFTTTWTMSLSRLELPPEAEARLAPLTRVFRERAIARPREEHLAAAAALREFAADARRQWGRYDVVLTPGLAMAPPAIGAFTSRSPDDDYRLQCEWAPCTSMVNVSGLPAIAVPTLALPDGLSMGVQLIGREGSEERLLALAEQLTSA